MTALEIARKLAAAGEAADAVNAYALSLQSQGDHAARMEAACYILQNGGDYRISYTVFRQLYQEGYCREDILDLMSKVFYEPNIKRLRTRYERNCRRLAKYPYLFRKDFLPFEELPIRFFPYDDHSGYVPFFVDKAEFGGYINVKTPVVSRNFFKDLEKPILADDVTSQYELEYLNDNVRRSEDVGRENHVYLHYTSFPVFCAWLQVLNLRTVLPDQKLVFLMEDELSLYPLDFKESFGIDYASFPLRSVGIREVNRMIWHTQLSTHNGGDFFNEIFDNHPNLLCLPSIMFSDIEKNVGKIRDALDKADSYQAAQETLREWDSGPLLHQLYFLRNRTDKDILVAMYLNAGKEWTSGLDRASRIAPALFFQPHFHNIVYQLRAAVSGDTVLEAKNVEQIHSSPLLRGFKYIKTFTPMRRFTTSHGATVKFMYQMALKSVEEAGEKTKADDKDGSDQISVVSDAISERVFNRSFMADPEDRLYRDSVVVRFEDGKLNPKATFTALAAFLDLPYTESMTYCSEQGIRDIDHEGNVVGFDPDTVYRTYDDYVNDDERYFIEYYLRDAYAFYGYDFQNYDGSAVDEKRVSELIGGFTTVDHYIRETWRKVYQTTAVMQGGERAAPEVEAAVQDQLLENYMQAVSKKRVYNAGILLEDLRFVNKNGQPLRMVPRLELDPALLEQPLYH